MLAARRQASPVASLGGAKPGELPVEQPAKFEFVVNAGAAKALGLAPAPAVRSRADKVIE